MYTDFILKTIKPKIQEFKAVLWILFWNQNLMFKKFMNVILKT